MELVAEDHNDMLVVTANTTRIDASVAIQFKDQMRDVTDHGAPRVVLDNAHGYDFYYPSKFRFRPILLRGLNQDAGHEVRTLYRRN